jgi:hypothetical protein
MHVFATCLAELIRTNTLVIGLNLRQYADNKHRFAWIISLYLNSSKIKKDERWEQIGNK